MFAGYNKNNARGALVGNWVEEDALRTATGYSRRKVPEPSSPGMSSIRYMYFHYLFGSL
jgi:hypothetical protein